MLAAPGVWWTLSFADDSLVYGEFVHRTGLFSLQLVILALAVTPLCRLLPSGVCRWLRRSRRHFGVASFAYLLMHAGAYLIRQPWARVLDDAITAAYATAWLGFVIMLALAVTSNDSSVRRLGRRWKTLHRLVYPAAALAFVHWLLTAFAPADAVPWLLLLAAVEGLRLVPRVGR